MERSTRFYKKALCCALTISLLAASLAGCGKKDKGDESNPIEEASKASKDYVFKAEEIDLGINSENFRELVLNNGRIHTVSGDGKSLSFISFKPDGSDLKTFSVPESDNESHNSFAYDEDDNVYCIYYKYSDEEYEETEDTEVDVDHETSDAEAEISGDEDKSEEDVSDDASEDMSEEVSDDVSEDVSEDASEDADENNVADTDDVNGDSTLPAGDSDEIQYLVKYDTDGKIVNKADLTDYQQDGYFSCGGMVYVKGYGLLICYDGGILKYTDDKGFESVVKTDNDEDGYGTYYTPYLGSDGKVYLSCYGDKGLELHLFDTKEEKVGDVVEIPVVTHGSEITILQGEGYPLYVTDDNGVYGYDIAGNTLVKLMDYMDSDVSVGYALTNFVALSDTEFIALLNDEDYNYHLNRLTKVPADQIKDKKIITLAGYYIDYDIRMSAVNFNRESDEYKIKLIDYSSFDTDEDYEAGTNKFNLDIASGNVPDVMVFRSYMPIDSYINKGLFEDLTGYFEKDPDMSESDFLPNIMDAFKTNGKLYQIVPAFYVSTMTAKTKYLEGKETVTFDDCRKLIDATGANYQFAFGVQQRTEMLETGLALSGNKYIDWENKTCSFNSESFIDFLEFTKNFPAEYKEDVWDTYRETFYRDGQSLFNMTFLQDFRSYKRYKEGTFGDDISFVGFPNDMGVNCSVIYPEVKIAIGSKSANKDGAWQFVRTFLTDEYQSKLNEYNFPVRKSAFDKMAEESTHRMYYMDGDEKVEYDDSYYLDDTEITIDPLTAQEVQELKDFIASLSLVYTSNESVNKIIEEEASAFYSGDKTAQEVADIIQSRVSIYVNENS